MFGQRTHEGGRLLEVDEWDVEDEATDDEEEGIEELDAGAGGDGNNDKEDGHDEDNYRDEDGNL